MRGREKEGYLMKHPGIVTMDGETIGNFVVENGMTVALSTQPDFNGGNDA
jgi:hypothetical protein